MATLVMTLLRSRRKQASEMNGRDLAAIPGGGIGIIGRCRLSCDDFRRGFDCCLVESFAFKCRLGRVGPDRVACHGTKRDACSFDPTGPHRQVSSYGYDRRAHRLAADDLGVAEVLSFREGEGNAQDKRSFELPAIVQESFKSELSRG